MTSENSSWYCASPEEPLRSVHVAYIYGSHAEDRVNERQREEDDSYCGKDKDGGFLAVFVGFDAVDVMLEKSVLVVFKVVVVALTHRFGVRYNARRLLY